MPDNKISPGVVSSGHVPGEAAAQASLLARLTARLRAGQFDRMLAVGVPAPEGSPIAVHAARLTTIDEREAIARSLRQSLDDARHNNPMLSSRVPVHCANIMAAQDLIDAVSLRLHSPRPVSPRGMARLRRLLSDGTGPMYRYGHGDLAGRLGAALAEL